MSRHAAQTEVLAVVKIQVVAKEAGKYEAMVTVVPAPGRRIPGGLGDKVGDLRVVDPADAGGAKDKGPVRVSVSAGKRSDCKPEILRRVGGAAAKWLVDAKVRRAGVDVASIETLKVSDGVAAFAEGMALGTFRFDRHKTNSQAGPGLTVHFIKAGAVTALRRSIDRLLEIAVGVELARDWSHEPPNVINPVTLATRIRSLARKSGLTCRVYDDKQLAKMKAEAILAVGVASKTPSRLIVLEYAGKGGQGKRKPVVLVGKAITFDTGGYSLKDKDGIVGMKYDKCGGMAVVGAMQAVAAVRPRTPVIGIIAAAENMISGEAYRPNDIVKTMNGKTVEIISTDAEGRMVLADALTYAQRHYRPHAIIDLATLTGGVVIALGAVRAGLFANDDALADALQAAGDRVHERLWRMPLDADYRELIKGDDSDIKNSGGRAAHPVIGGIFLKEFVDEKVPWAHLDIAGVANCEKDQPYCPKGATGFGVRLLLEYLTHL